MGLQADRQLIDQERIPSGRVFWTGVIAGWAVIAFGIWGAIFESRNVDHRLAVWLVGGLLVHDLVIAPIVFATGMILRRAVPARSRATISAALIVSAIFVVTSIPMLGRFGEREDNPTALPGNYTAGLMVMLAIVWSFTALVMLRAWRRSRSQT